MQEHDYPDGKVSLLIDISPVYRIYSRISFFLNLAIFGFDLNKEY